jgi:hypothetical protein
MQSKELRQGPVRRAFNDLVMAEVFLVQATIESASVIGEGFSEMSGRLTSDLPRDRAQPSFSTLLQRTAEGAMEPYTTRLKYLRQLADS